MTSAHRNTKDCVKDVNDPGLLRAAAIERAGLGDENGRHRLQSSPEHGMTWSVVPGCQNCGTTRGYIEEIWTDDGGKPLLCEDCAEEVRHLEKLADALAAAPSCPLREQILDAGDTTAVLVNRLRAHDMTPCASCQSLLKTLAEGVA